MKIWKLKNYALVIFLLWYLPLGAQEISNHYGFGTKDLSSCLFVKDNLYVGMDSKRLNKKIKNKYLYSYFDNQKKDSLLLPRGTSWMSLVLGPVFFGDDIYFCTSPTWQVLKVDASTGKFSISQSIDLKSDTVSIFGDVEKRFILYKWKRYLNSNF